jgi:hypothetical protein
MRRTFSSILSLGFVPAALACAQTPTPPPAQGAVNEIPAWARPALGDQAPPTPVMTVPQAPRMASDDAQALLEKGEVFFLDVREPYELEQFGTLEGYVNIPLGQIEARLDELPKDKAIITA